MEFKQHLKVYLWQLFAGVAKELASQGIPVDPTPVGLSLNPEQNHMEGTLQGADICVYPSHRMQRLNVRWGPYIDMRHMVCPSLMQIHAAAESYEQLGKKFAKDLRVVPTHWPRGLEAFYRFIAFYASHPENRNRQYDDVRRMVEYGHVSHNLGWFTFPLTDPGLKAVFLEPNSEAAKDFIRQWAMPASTP